MNLNRTSKEIHQNAIDHGWWEGDRSEDEIIALIHSEWSEALEAYRDDSALHYVFDGKPEGIAVELIDGCIRILDLFAKFSYRSDSTTLVALEARSRETFMKLRKETPVPAVVATLHWITSSAHQIAQMQGGFSRPALAPLEAAVGVACAWIRMQGGDPDAILLEKHRYNLTRPYKHGGKRC